MRRYRLRQLTALHVCFSWICRLSSIVVPIKAREATAELYGMSNSVVANIAKKWTDAQKRQKEIITNEQLLATYESLGNRRKRL